MPINTQKPYPKRPRLHDRSSYIGERLYFITITTNKRNQFFVHEHITKSMINYLYDISQKKLFDVLVYCFMPDHVHLLLRGTSHSSNLTKFISAYKQKTGFTFKKRFDANLWAKSFHDHVLRKEEKIQNIGKYILENPVRAGLVENMLDYPYSGSFTYDLEKFI